MARHAAEQARHASAQRRQWSWCWACLSHSAAQASQLSAHMAQSTEEPCRIVSMHRSHSSRHSSHRRAHSSIPGISRQASWQVWHSEAHSSHASMHRWVWSSFMGLGLRGADERKSDRARLDLRRWSVLGRGTGSGRGASGAAPLPIRSGRSIVSIPSPYWRSLVTMRPSSPASSSSVFSCACG